MCGICGIGLKDRNSLQKGGMEKMLECLAHRGPDASETFTSKDHSVLLGHRRLSIIDLSDSANQPMTDLSGRYTVVFNGEIYNYLELREQLQRIGVRFRTQSDTEVLLQLYMQKKAAFLAELDGMFAFAIWDDQEKELFLARDRMGEKPLFYYYSDDCLLFASEIKAINAYLGKSNLNQDRLQVYLDRTGLKASEASFFEDIHLFPAAHYAQYSLKRDESLQFNRYWELDLNKSISYRNESDYIEEFRDLFLQSLKRRLRSDVSLGTSLSGGLDSSAILSVIKEGFKLDINSFSARFNDSELDEGKWIQAVIDRHPHQNSVVYPNYPALMKKIEQISYYHERPIESASMFAQWEVMDLVKKNKTKVLIDGQGADEYLGGYKPFKYFVIWDHFFAGRLGDFKRERDYFKSYFGDTEKLGWRFVLYPFLKRLGNSPFEWKNGSSFRERSKYSIEEELPFLLASADRNAMAHSIEVRLPFTAHELVEFCFAIPSDMIYRNGKTKYILRKALEKEIPKEIQNRTDKVGFKAPQNKWLSQNLTEEELRMIERQIMDLGLKPSKYMWRNFACAAFIQSSRS